MNTVSLPTKRGFSWKVFFIVWAAAVLGAIALIPFVLSQQLEALGSADLPMPLWQLIAIGILQSLLILGVLTGIGLLLAGRIGLGLPFVEGWLKKELILERPGRVLLVFIGVGVVVSLILAGLDKWVFEPPIHAELIRLGIPIPEKTQTPIWQGFLASFYGGITEEVLLRLFLMTFLAWLGSLISRDGEGRPTAVVFWLAIIVATVVFGLGHLPATAALGVPLSPLVVTRAITLNGLPGFAFGWLYWKRGLESAIVAHFSADIVLHVILVPVL